MGLATTISPRLFHSSAVRLTLLYAAVFAVSVVGLMGFVTWSATGYMAQQIDNTVTNELAEVQADAGSGGDEAVRQVIEALVVRSPGMFYLLQSSQGALVAGNMRQIQPYTGVRVLKSPHQQGLGRARGGIRGRGVVLPSGSYLFVGLSAYELNEMREVLVRAAAWGLAVTALIALAGGLATSFWLLRRIDAIGLASRQIMSGDLGRRIALSGSGDEFDRLAAGLNEMLDRIQQLMRGLQQVSSDIAHDLRTPLTRLRQRLEVARRRSKTTADFEQSIDAAIGDSEAILASFAALLRIAQVEAGTRRAGFMCVDLSTLLLDVSEAYGPDLEAAGLTLTTRIAAGLRVSGDRELLSQLLPTSSRTPCGTVRPGHAWRCRPMTPQRPCMLSWLMPAPASHLSHGWNCCKGSLAWNAAGPRPEADLGSVSLLPLPDCTRAALLWRTTCQASAAWSNFRSGKPSIEDAPLPSTLPPDRRQDGVQEPTNLLEPG